MTNKQFVEKYCRNCGSQRCEGIGTEWFEGCRYRWNHDDYDAATEIEKLNKQVITLSSKLAQVLTEHPRQCKKCVYELHCSHERNINGMCPDYKRDPPDGGYYG